MMVSLSGRPVLDHDRVAILFCRLSGVFPSYRNVLFYSSLNNYSELRWHKLIIFDCLS